MAGQRRRTEARGFRKNPKFASSEATWRRRTMPPGSSRPAGSASHSFSEAERKASRHEEGRPVRWTREFRPDADIPDDPRRQLVAKADLRADDGRLAARDGLLGEDVADDRGAGELRSAHRIAGAERELVPAVALLVAVRRQELIAGIEVNAQAFDRFRDNALRLDGKESTSRPTALEREAPACLDGDLSSGDRIGVIQSERATFVQILVIDSSGGTSSEPYQHKDRNGGDDC